VPVGRGSWNLKCLREDWQKKEDAYNRFMVLLLAGTSEVGRNAIATKIVKDWEQWRHLPVEQLAEIEMLSEANPEGDESLLVRIACHCAKEMNEEGFHLLISMPFMDNAHDIAKEELGEDIVAVHLGPMDHLAHSDFPHRINTDEHSVTDTIALLAALLPSKPAA